jgi:Zn-dependent protease with chaperone function
MADDAQNLFAITTLGKLTPGRDPDAVAESVAARFRLEPEQAKRLVRKSTVIARNLTEEKARALKKVLLGLGLITRVLSASAVSEQQGAEPAATRDARAAAIKALLAGIDREFERPVRPATYYAWGALVALFAILVPIVYLGFVSGAAYGAWLWVVNVPLPTNWWRVTIWVTVPVTLAVMALILLRPALSGLGKPARLELAEDQQTPLYHLVRTLCRRIGVPEPSNVYVDADVNAYVTPKGLTGMLRGKLELTIGLPFVTGMQARQLASVIAHEFGHFAQPMEMFVSTIVNGINGWMYYAGWGHDPWEERLDRLRSHDGLGLLWLPLTAALLSIFAVRWLMRWLCLLNIRVTSGFSRQMEFDADRYAVAAIGSRAFAESEIRARELLHAAAVVEEINTRAFQENKLLDDLPSMIAQTHERLSDEELENVRRSLDEDAAHYWATHPAGSDRIEAANALGVADIDVGDFPATWLIQELPKLSRWTTQIFYQKARGVQKAADFMMPNEQVLNLVEEQDAAWEAVERFFLDTATRRIYEFEAPTDEDILAQDEAALLERLKQTRASYLESAKRYHDALELCDRIFVADMYSRHGVELAAGDFGLQVHDPRTLERRLDETLKQIAREGAALGIIDRMYYRRADLAIACLSPDDQQRARRMLEWLRALAPAREPMERLRRYTCVINSILNLESSNESLWQEMQQPLCEFRDFSVEELNAVIDRLNRIPNLLSSAQKGESVADYLATFGVERVGSTELSHPQNVSQMAYQLHETLFYQYFRVLGDLANLCRSHWESDDVEAFAGTSSG